MSDHPFPDPDIAALIRRGDYDRYVLAMTARRDRRADLLALLAWNLEVARTREAAREPGLGLIRLQWWRDRIDAIDAARIDQDDAPAAVALAGIVSRHGLEPALLRAMVEARTADVAGERQPFADMAALRSYAAATAGSLNILMSRILGVRGAAEDRAASAIGAGWALLGLVRAIPFLSGHDWSPLPRALAEGREVRLVCREIAVLAEELFAEGLAAPGGLRGAGAPILLQASLGRHYRRLLAEVDFDPYTATAQSLRPPIASLLVRRVFGRY